MHAVRPARRNWLVRVRLLIPWLFVPLAVIAAYAMGLPDGDWRTPRDVMLGIDPRLLVPLPRLGFDSVLTLATRWLLIVVLAVPIGAIVWAWRGSTRGGGLFAACAGFTFFLLFEFGRAFKPGQLPDLRDPIIGASVAFLVWWLLRYSPTQPETPLPRYGPWKTRRRILFRFLLADVLLLMIGGAVVMLPEIRDLGLTPARVAAQIERLPEGRSGVKGVAFRVVAGAFSGIGVVSWLKSANQIDRSIEPALPGGIGAGAAFDGVSPAGRLRPASSIDALRAAIDNALPGDVIVLSPGVYRVKQSYITFIRPGSAAAPITLRASRLGTVTVEAELPETFKVDAPWWRFENIVLKGVCSDDSVCDNGFHIVGRAENTVIRNMRIEDFNAQIKINGENGSFPDNGRIEHNSLINTHSRRTDASVTPIDLVAANGWSITNNLIADFIKDGGNRVSYGAFAKGASRGTIFSRNVIVCEWRLRGPTSESIGLSFGGGGTGQRLTRDMGLSGSEHADGVMSENLIAFCSDDGIYLNRAANSAIRHNTLIGTGGIDVRYPETIAQIEGNMVDGPIRARDDGWLWEDGNENGSLMGMFVGRNPVRAFYADAGRLDLRWRSLPVLVATQPGLDLCAAEWATLSPAGAVRDFRSCEAGRSP